DHFEQSINNLENLLLAEVAPLAQRKGNILAYCQRVEQCAILKDLCDFLADRGQLLLGVVGYVLERNDHAAGVWLENTHDVVRRPGSTYAAASQDAEYLC